MRPAFRLALSAGLLCLAACQRSPDTDGPDTDGVVPADAGHPPVPAAASGAASAAGGDAIAAHYACDAGARLSRRDDGSFRAEIPGNPPVRLARIAGSAPPVFTGASLYLRIEGSGEAILSQGDRTNELRCTPGQPPA